ncbi:MAG: pyridoxal phosphate-dependent class II aminotransferase [Desulfosarcina sp.]|jgi:threonine-phosphate decarboxylase
MIGGHGGNIHQLARHLGCRPSEISDMSANVNPLGPLPALIAHVKASLPAIAALPEVDASGIVEAFARHHGIDPGQVMPGNGTTELIYLIPRALEAKNALVVGPTYADYHDACRMSRTTCAHLICPQSDHFIPDMQAIRRAAATVDLVFLCNPNNPTGTLLARQAIQDLCQSLPDTIFVIDESYLPFAPRPSAVSVITADNPNLLVLNSMSKAFRIPGLRIGFVTGPTALITRLAAYGLPWSVNALAQAAVAWLMGHPHDVAQFLASTRAFIEKEKRRIEESIHQESQARCFSSATSFILMRLPRGMKAAAVGAHMAGQRILIRDCTNFIGLSDAFIRVSLRSETENRRAMDLLVRLFSDQADPRSLHVP